MPMKTKVIVLCLLIFILMQITGCKRSPLENTTNKNTTLETSTNVITDEERMDIYIASQFNKSTEKPFVKITDKEILKEFSKILNESDRIQGILDVKAPDYVVDISKIDKETETIYLWVGEEGAKGMYMNKDRTETGYSISAVNTRRLKKIITNKWS